MIVELNTLKDLTDLAKTLSLNKYRAFYSEEQRALVLRPSVTGKRDSYVCMAIDYVSKIGELVVIKVRQIEFDEEKFR